MTPEGLDLVNLIKKIKFLHRLVDVMHSKVHGMLHSAIESKHSHS